LVTRKEKRGVRKHHFMGKSERVSQRRKGVRVFQGLSKSSMTHGTPLLHRKNAESAESETIKAE